MDRRALLRTTTFLVPVLALAACSGVTKAVDAVVAVAPQVARDAAMIADALAAILPTIERIAGVSSTVMDKVSAAVATVRATATAIAGATTATAGGLVQQLSSGVASVVGLLGGAAVPPWVSTVLAAAGALVPLIEQGVGLVTSAMPHTARRMPADEARRVLASASGR